MNKLWLLIKKNLKLLTRSKTSALVVFFAPLMIILILGLAYNTTSKYGLNIGVHADSFTEDVNSFIDILQEKEYKITKYDSSMEDCINDLKSGATHACISLPESLSIEDNTAKEIIFYIDPSKINLVWAIQEAVGSKFELKSEEISQQLAQNILAKLSDTKTKVEEQSNELSSAKEKSQSASSSAESLASSLNSLDLSVPGPEYDLSAVAGFKSSFSTAVKKSENSIDDAIDAVEGAEITSGKEELLTALALAKTSVKSLGGNDSKSLEEILSLVESLNHDLVIAKEKLTSASTAVSSTSASLGSTSATIKESISTLENVQASLNNVKTNIESQKVTEAGIISSPLTTKIEMVSPKSSYLNYIFPALLVLVVMFSSLLLGTTLVMMEKNSPAFFRNYFVPIRKETFVASIFLTNLIISLVQIIIILGVSLFFLKEKNPLMMFPVAGVLLLSSSVFTFLGMGLGYLFKSEETGTLASISLGSFLLFMSGVIIPIESISLLLRKMTVFNPFVISEKIIREIFLFNSPLKSVSVDLLILIGYIIILFLIIVIINYLTHKHLVEHFIRKHHKIHWGINKSNKHV